MVINHKCKEIYFENVTRIEKLKQALNLTVDCSIQNTSNSCTTQLESCLKSFSARGILKNFVGIEYNALRNPIVSNLPQFLSLLLREDVWINELLELQSSGP